jgi:hypothetical protein
VCLGARENAQRVLVPGAARLEFIREFVEDRVLAVLTYSDPDDTQKLVYQGDGEPGLAVVDAPVAFEHEGAIDLG